MDESPGYTKPNTLAQAFHARVATQTVVIKRLFPDENGQSSMVQGTGVILSFGVPDDNAPVHIATAGHVLDGIGDGVSQWAIQRVELDDDGLPVEFYQTFHDKDFRQDRAPSVVVTKYLRDCDIGLMLVENRTDSGGWLIDPTKHKRLNVIPTEGYLQTCARVAWCGFPGFVANMTGSQTLCYCEGIVACCPSTPPLYLVDGHAAQGMSGGPMWILAGNGDPIITGICIRYDWPEATPSGLVGFCPLQVLLRVLEGAQQ